MRHADAAAAEAYANDDLRPLSARGREVQTKVTLALRRMEIEPDLIVSSPRLRTVQTAAITASGMGLTHAVVEHAALGQAYSIDSALDMLWEFDSETLLCVGHDPDLRELGGVLLGLEQVTHIKFPKSAVLGLEFRGRLKPGAGTLRFFYRPDHLLALLGDGS